MVLIARFLFIAYLLLFEKKKQNNKLSTKRTRPFHNFDFYTKNAFFGPNYRQEA